MHTTNYQNTLIEVAADCPADFGLPPEKADTIAGHQYSLLVDNPYRLTSDDLLYEVHRRRSTSDAFPDGDPKTRKSRDEFFSKPQACLRASPLGKRFGWGTHHDSDGKIAVYSLHSPEYLRLAQDERITKVPAMRNKRT